ncbi:hypothetical protein DKL61_02610 [Gammaproteobacteria bacterium ESL0073]|nr:hypothetical protein DKL61_02610 [Gammaproteobacteria bacterium ESL0073]
MNASLQSAVTNAQKQSTQAVITEQASINNNPSSSTELRVLRIQQVAEKLSIGKSTIYDWLKPNSPRYDETFPKPFKLGGKAIGWLSSEVDAWLLNRVALTRVTDLSEIESDTL